MADEHATRETAPPQPLDILVVDDEEIILTLVREILAARGHTVRTVTSAAAALDAFKERSPDLLMTDMRMPHMDGLALGLRVRQLYPETRIVLITGYFSEYSQSSAKEIGIEEIIKKPFKSAQLLGVVDRLAQTRNG